METSKLVMSVFLGCVFFLVLALTGCSFVNKMVGLKDDNPIEEGIEDLIEHAIEEYVPVKVDIDLTPDSPEK